MWQDFSWQTIPWQEGIVGVCVIAAIVFLVRRWLFKPAKTSAACGGCGGCDKTSSTQCANPTQKS